jgi:hypothetical protein
MSYLLEMGENAAHLLLTLYLKLQYPSGLLHFLKFDNLQMFTIKPLLL